MMLSGHAGTSEKRIQIRSNPAHVIVQRCELLAESLAESEGGISDGISGHRCEKQLNVLISSCLFIRSQQ